MSAAVIATPPAPWSPAFLDSATYLALDLQPRHPAAVALVEALTQRALAADTRRRNQRRQAGLAKLRHAVGAIVGGLLRAWWSQDPPRPVWHSNQAEAFTPRLSQYDRLPILSAGGMDRAPIVGRRVFKTVIDTLKADQLIAHKHGVRLPPQAAVRMGQGRQVKSARYWPTAALLHLAEAQGLTPQTIARAFRAPPPLRAPVSRPPIMLRPLQGTLWQRRRAAGRPPVQRVEAEHRQPLSAAPPCLAEEVAAHNALAATTPITFPTETPCHQPQWYRLFLGSWRLHGRWYATGAGSDPAVGHVSSYANLKSPQRAQLRMGGEPVVELDVSASHLTLLLGLLGGTLPAHDPYEGLSYPRAVVKQWVLEVCGKGRPPGRWSSKRLAEALLPTEPIKVVGAAVMQRFPELEQPATVVPDAVVAEVGRSAESLVTHYLTAREAEAISLALRALRAQGILALPVHDSLIVPVRAEQAARQAITAGYSAVCNLQPRIKAKPRPNS
ncbi:hypothetical protein QMO56_19375 [Roseomonas sp. E05]|uniref:hypothetical protein n=1 Tax=Roseomonas sp. E05 TaxID=3046310 RepID=UPI0024B96CED|nr:hypothetical protein [Roseomonas sp. E05]MDJ0390278.1 hypothetical protein [Roseomonas sp. E05]